MQQASKNFQAVNDTRSRSVKILLSVHSIDVALAYGWEVIPTWEPLQQR